MCLHRTSNPAVDSPTNPEDQKDVLKQLMVSIVGQVESTKESNSISKLEHDRKLEKDKEKKDNMGKLHPTVKRQFLMAASTDSEEIAQDIPDSCKVFFDQDAAPLSDQELTEQLVAMR